MKIIFDSETKSIVLFEKGDEPLPLLATLALERGKSFFFSMIGGASVVETAFYYFDKKDYETKVHEAENIEIVSVTGNVAWYDGSPMVHAHGVFGNEAHECFGGHIMRMTISAVGETLIDWIPQKLEKKLETESGLKVFCPN